jgi:hypothetical protein
MPMGIGGIWAGREDAARGTEEAVGGLRPRSQAIYSSGLGYCKRDTQGPRA